MHALILAAGVGRRLSDVVTDVPKGLITIGDTTLVERAIGLLHRAGIADVVIATGHRAERYEALAAASTGVRTVHSARYADTGTMHTLTVALDALGLDGGSEVLVVNGDIMFEARAVSALCRAPWPDVLLVTGFDRRGDEVSVGTGPDGRIQTLSKDASRVPEPVGEFIGLSRLTSEMLDLMVACSGRGAIPADRIGYEAVLDVVAPIRPLRAVIVEDLIWGEVDDRAQLERLRCEVQPAIAAAERPPGEASSAS